MRMDELYDDEDDGGLSDCEEFEYSFEQAQLELSRDPFYALWLEWTRTYTRTH